MCGCQGTQASEKVQRWVITYEFKDGCWWYSSNSNRPGLGLAAGERVKSNLPHRAELTYAEKFGPDSLAFGANGERDVRFLVSKTPQQQDDEKAVLTKRFTDNAQYERLVVNQYRIPREFRWLTILGKMIDLRQIDREYLDNICTMCERGTRAGGIPVVMDRDRISMCLNASFERGRREERKVKVSSAFAAPYGVQGTETGRFRTRIDGEFVMDKKADGSYVVLPQSSKSLTRAEFFALRAVMPKTVEQFMKDNGWDYEGGVLTFAEVEKLIDVAKNYADYPTAENRKQQPVVREIAAKLEQLLLEEITGELREFDREVNEE